MERIFKKERDLVTIFIKTETDTQIEVVDMIKIRLKRLWDLHVVVGRWTLFIGVGRIERQPFTDEGKLSAYTNYPPKTIERILKLYE